MKNEDSLRRVAANIVRIDGKCIRQAIVEIAGGRVVGWYPFTDEQPFTEWLGGTIVIDNTEGELTASWNGKRLI